MEFSNIKTIKLKAYFVCLTKLMLKVQLNILRMVSLLLNLKQFYQFIISKIWNN